jgi:MFS family permease
MVALLPPLTRQWGLVAILGAAIASATLLSLVYPFANSLTVWTLLRFLMGAALGVVFTLSEYWINVAAPPERRGVVMGLYATTLYAGFALGPILLGLLMGPDGGGLAPWFATAGLMALGMIPLLMARDAAPAMDSHGSASPWRFIRAAPAATLGAFVFGVVETGAMLLLPVHGLRLGLDAQAATWLLAAFTLGNVALQLPLGFLSDRIERLPLLAGIALLSGGILFLLLGVQNLWLAAGLLFFAGGISGGIYPLSLALIGERFTDEDLAAANGAVVALYSVGLIVGPPLTGLVIDAMGSAGLPLALGGCLVAYGAGVMLEAKKARPKP